MNKLQEKLGDIILDILCWIFETKAGHFLFIAFFGTMIGLTLYLFVSHVSLGAIIAGASIVGIIAAVRDKNERWI